MDFTIDCTGCKAGCCKKMGEVLKVYKDFPYGEINGVCEKLENDRCSIYDSRPWQCRSNEARKLFNVSDKEFINMQRKSCQALNLE
jgi:hypothetical protein